MVRPLFMGLSQIFHNFLKRSDEASVKKSWVCHVKVCWSLGLVVLCPDGAGNKWKYCGSYELESLWKLCLRECLSPYGDVSSEQTKERPLLSAVFYFVIVWNLLIGYINPLISELVRAAAHVWPTPQRVNQLVEFLALF